MTYRAQNIIVTGLIIVVFALAAIFIGLAVAHAHDRSGYWAKMASEGKAPTKEWWNSLASPGRGPCCSFADGFRVDDVDWDTQDGRYRVRLRGKWINVEPDAVITTPNLAGISVVWPVCSFANGNGMAGQTPCGELDVATGKMKWADGVQVWYIRCFMPSSMS